MGKANKENGNERMKEKTDEILPTPKKRKGKGMGKGMVDKSATLGMGEGEGEGTGNPTTTQVQTLPSITEIGRVASICAEAFRNAISEHEREEYTWTVFRLVADEFKVKVVDDLRGMIRQCFDEVKPCRVVEELQEMDSHVGRTTKAYKRRMEDLFDEYNWQSKTNTALYKTESLKAMWLTLKKEGYRFVEQKLKCLTYVNEHGDGNDDGANVGQKAKGKHDVIQWTGEWQEMTQMSATEFLRQKMLNIGRMDRRFVKTKNAQLVAVPVPLDEPVGPFAMDGPPPPNSIVCDKSNEKKGNPGNVVYRKTISKNARGFKNEETNYGKTAIANLVIDDLQQQGYSFVVKKDGVWSTMETGELVKRVWKSLKDCARDRYRDCAVREFGN